MATTLNDHGLLALPPEVLAKIFSFITAPTDRVKVCLVCTEARVAMLPLLYNAISFVAEDTTTLEKIAPLLNSSNPGLQHVRHLRVDATSERNPGQWRTSELMLTLMINVLPRDCLRTISTNADIEEEEQFLSLLGQHQRKLEHLGLPKNLINSFLKVRNGRIEHLPELRSLDIVGFDELETSNNEASEMYTPGLRQLGSLRINLADVGFYSDVRPAVPEPERSHAIARYLLGFLEDDEDEIGNIEVKSTASALVNITRLGIVKANIGTPAHNAMMQVFNFEHMTCLILQSCGQPASLLLALAGREDIRLRTFVLETTEFGKKTPGQDPDTVLRTFLTSFVGLQTLKLHVALSAKTSIVSSTAVTHHRATLEVLYIHFTEGGGHRWDLDDIIHISDECSELRQLGLVLAPIPLSSEGPTFHSSHNKNYFDDDDDIFGALRAIAKLPNLVTLHVRRLPTMIMTHAKKLPESEHVAAYQEHHLKRLTEACIAQCFRGTKLRVMAWGDRTLHQHSTHTHTCDAWSDMVCYVREELVDGRGRQQTVALRTEKTQVKYIEPEVDILGVGFRHVT